MELHHPRHCQLIYSQPRCYLRYISPSLVPETGLEPARLSALRSKRSMAAITSLRHIWCSRRDSNPQSLRRGILSAVCIPVPSPEQFGWEGWIRTIDNLFQRQASYRLTTSQDWQGWVGSNHRSLVQSQLPIPLGYIPRK